MKKFLEIITNKWLIKGTTTVALVAIVIAIYILLNWGVEKINLEDLDCTEKKLYSLSEETKNKIENIDKEIKIELINMANYDYVKEYARKYTKANKNIKIEEINDLSARVDLMTKYNIESTESLIVIKTEEKEKTITVDELYTIDYSTYEQIDTTEEALTNAIVEIMINEKPQIYILSGKAYYDTKQALYTTIEELKDDANEVNYLDILTTGNIPEDCSCLIITTLSKDLSELERDKILEYIQKGGKLMMLTSQNVLKIETPNFNQVLAQYGISIGFGVIFEQDASKMLQNSPEFVITDVNASFMENIDMSMQMCFVDPGKLNFENEEKLAELGVEYEAIATTGEKSFVRTNFELDSYSRTDKDSEEGSNIIGAVVTKTINENTKSKLIIYSNELCASNLPIPVSPQYNMPVIDLYNNKDVILNSIAHLTERTDIITIRKTNEQEAYTVNNHEDAMIKTIIFLLPVLIIGTGVVVWQVRRRKK